MNYLKSLFFKDLTLPKDLVLPETLPKDLTLLYLSYLDLEYLQVFSQSKNWEALTKDDRLLGRLQPLLPKIAMITDRFWKREEFSALKIDLSDYIPMGVGDVQTLIPLSKKLLDLVEDGAGITLLTIPKGLSVNKLVTFFKYRTEQFGSFFRKYNWKEFKATFGCVEVAKTYRVIITNNVLLKSREKSVKDQRELVKKLPIKCRLAKVIEMCSLLMATFLNSNKRLLPKGTYSRCDENVGGVDGTNSVIGSFLLEGFYFSWDSGLVDKRTGVAVRQKF